VTHRVAIPLRDGFDYIVEPRNWPGYWPGLVRVQPGSRWRAPGDRARVVMRLLGRTVELEMTLRTFDRYRIIEYTSVQQGLPACAMNVASQPPSMGRGSREQSRAARTVQRRRPQVLPRSLAAFSVSRRLAGPEGHAQGLRLLAAVHEAQSRPRPRGGEISVLHEMGVTPALIESAPVSILRDWCRLALPIVR
jgi:hypothetical protein